MTKTEVKNGKKTIDTDDKNKTNKRKENHTTLNPEAEMVQESQGE